jgi:four helix bundle protein
LTDCDGENTETLVWLEFALACRYINESQFKELFELNNEIGKLLGHAISNPDKY